MGAELQPQLKHEELIRCLRRGSTPPVELLQCRQNPIGIPLLFQGAQSHEISAIGLLQLTAIARSRMPLHQIDVTTDWLKGIEDTIGPSFGIQLRSLISSRPKPGHHHRPFRSTASIAELLMG